ncbi:MAG: BTAD domain-containing putative transcriptional regulator [Caldilineaceae bacterium]
MAGLELTLFGSPRLKLGGQDIPYKIPGKALALFIYLAVTGKPQQRDVLADLLWSEYANQEARNNLRYQLPDLRQALGHYLIITPQTIGFNRQNSYWLDVEILRTTLAAGVRPVNPQILQAALDLYQAEFLAGFTVRNAPVFEAWMVRQREELHQSAVQGLYTLAELYQQQGDYRAGLATTQRLLHWEPWCEKGHRLQMQLLAARGQRAAALAQYALCRQVLMDELGVAPETETVTLAEQIRAGSLPGKSLEAHAFVSKQKQAHKSSAPLVTPSAYRAILPPKHNLPAQLTALLGREQEIAELRAKLLEPEQRLITLVGEGGVGKTRLALAVAQSMFDGGGWPLAAEATAQAAPPAKASGETIQQRKFPDGVWFVPLVSIPSPIARADQLAVAVAQAIGLQFSGHQPLLAQLFSYLRTKAQLLLFDNAEHLLPELADFLVQLLQASPRTMALVTSRHLLDLQAEWVWRVVGLPVPPPDKLASLTAAELLTYSSIALFDKRVRQFNHDFQITPENQAAVTGICRLVEGLPLALELAAALTKQYTCAELYTALQHDYTILAATLRDLPARHHSIQAMLDYSWRFLTPDEARTLAACSRFASSFTSAAAAAVTGAGPLVLAKLVDQSLLQRHEGRFILHELVRQYAAAQLAHMSEWQHAALARHAAYYMELLHNLETALLNNFAAQETVQRELDNVRAAWHWSAEQGNLVLLGKGLESLQRYYRLAGLYREAIHLLERPITAVRLKLAAEPTATRLRCLLVSLLCHATQFYRRMGRVETGEGLAQEALNLGRQLADPALQALAYHELARLAQVRSDYLTMYTLAEQGCMQARQAGLPQLTAECLNDLGIATSSCMHPQSAIPQFHEALNALQGSVNRYLEARLFGNLGFFHLSCHEYHWAYRYLLQARAAQQQLQDREGGMITQILLGDLWTALGVYAEARQQYEQVLALMQTIYDPYWNSWLLASYGRLQHLCGDPAAAYTTCTHAQQIAQKGRSHIQEQWILTNLGHALADLGREAASDCYRQAIALQDGVNWTYRMVDAQAGFAALLLAQNESATALSYAEAALAILAQQGLAAAKEPFQIYWTCVRVLMTACDPRAHDVLHTAYQALQEIASKLEDKTLRRSFLENVVANRALIAAAEAIERV